MICSVRVAASALCLLLLSVASHAAEDIDWLGSMSWRAIGPARGGRVQCVTGVVGEPDLYYMGATGGGVWKTTDGGERWANISDGFFNTGSVGAIAVAPTDPNVIYVGMGEADVRGNFSHGDGVYRSLDAGKTWAHMGLDDTRQIGHIVVHPGDPMTVYVAALGHVFGPNAERGLFRSTDGGETWDKIKYIDDRTGAFHIAVDPFNPRVLFASFWRVSRTPWSLESGGEGSGLYRSTRRRGVLGAARGRPARRDGREDRRSSVSPGAARPGLRDRRGGGRGRLPLDRRGRLVAEGQQRPLAPPARVVLHADHRGPGRGGHGLCDECRLPQVDRRGAERSAGAACRTRTTTTCGSTRSTTDRMINANDGGANVSYDGGRSWSTQTNQPTAQFYHVTVDNSHPYRVYGAQQDNSTASVSSLGREARQLGTRSVQRGRVRVRLHRGPPREPRHRLRGLLRRVPFDL
jgi:hypothetical protein